MKWPFWRTTAEALLALAMAVVVLPAFACDPSNSVKPGPPVLLDFTINDRASGSPYALTDDAGTVSVPGYVRATAVFDRLLGTAAFAPDPKTGGDIGSDAATVTATPGPPPPVTLIYTPNGGELALAFSPNPSVTVAGVPTFPSGATITIALDKGKLHSKANEPFTGEGALADGRITFETQPFAATIAAPADAMSPVVVTFNNLPADTATTFIKVQVNGAASADFTIAPDPGGNPTIFNLMPGTPWPAGATVQVDVAVEATDALGAPLAAPATATFPAS